MNGYPSSGCMRRPVEAADELWRAPVRSVLAMHPARFMVRPGMR